MPGNQILQLNRHLNRGNEELGRGVFTRNHWQCPPALLSGRVLAAVVGMILGACVGEPLVVHSQALQGVLPSFGMERASEYNKPHQGRTSDCGKLRDPNGLIPLRYADGTPTGYYVSGQYPVSRRQVNQREGKALDREGCPQGTTEIDAREVVDSPAGKMIFHPGGGSYPYPGGVEKWGHYGHILLSDFVAPPSASDPYKGQPVGNGMPCAAAKPGQTTYGEYYIKPTRIDDEMWYKKPNGKRTGARYQNYGDRGHEGMFMVWNWVQNGSTSTIESDNHLPGGGYVRAVLKPGMLFSRCDVEALKTVSYGLDNEQNGWVKVVYGKIFTGKEWLYGWVIHSYEKWTRNTSGQIEKKYVEVLWPISRGRMPLESGL